MDFPKETESEKKMADSSLWLHKSNSLPDILTEINHKVQKMLRLVQEDSEHVSTEKFLCLYQSLGETYNDLNQELLKSLTFDIRVSCSDQSNGSSLKPQKSDEMVQSLKLNGENEKNHSGYLIADIFCAELETAQRELEERNIEIETEKRRVLDLESKLLDSSSKIENLKSELEVGKELLEVSEAEVSKLMEMLNECKTEKAKLETGDASDLLDSLREELRSRDVQIEQMEEYLNEVLCHKDSEIVSESGTEKDTVEKEELRGRVEEMEKQVELQRNVIKEREEEKREAIRQLCFSLDHYMSRYFELVRSLSDYAKR